jgi:thioester reductase-like protein/pimeloyl-ACP methyl ester carboxylesterase
MKAPRTILVTGATGFLGRHAVRRILMDLPDTRVICLVRGSSVDKARARLVQAIEEAAHDAGNTWDARSLARLDVWLGDVTLPRCGIEKLATLPQLEVFHFAASLCFEETQRLHIALHNVEGTSNVLDLSHALGAERFVYVSTAYTCGRKQGLIAEQLHDGSQGFCNAYEESKDEAERQVMARCTELGLRGHIVRPSIVVGSLRTHRSSGSDTGLYGFMRELLRTRRILCEQREPVRIEADRDAPLNLVSIDAVMDQFFSLHARAFEQRTVHHLSSDICPTVGQTLDAVCDAVGVPRFDVQKGLSGPLSTVEAVFAKRITFYGNYLSGERQFERQGPGSFALTQADLQRLVVQYVTAEEEKKQVLSARWLRARDGMPLRIYTSDARGKTETVVLVNAFGMPVTVFDALAKVLAPHVRLLSWTSRGVPELTGVLDDESARFSRHVDDLEDVLAAHGVHRAHLIGYCTGADVALSFATRSPERVQSLTLAHGAFVGISSARTAFATSLETIARRAARSVEEAGRFHDMIAEVLSPYFAGSSRHSHDRALLETTVGQLDSSLFHLTSAPFRTPEALHRYAKLLCGYFADAPLAPAHLSVPTHIVTSEDDTVAHVEGSRSLADSLPYVRETDATQGGHFSITQCERTIASMVRFVLMMREAPESRAA